jgi:hypothetical protein
MICHILLIYYNKITQNLLEYNSIKYEYIHKASVNLKILLIIIRNLRSLNNLIINLTA